MIGSNPTQNTAATKKRRGYSSDNSRLKMGHYAKILDGQLAVWKVMTPKPKNDWMRQRFMVFDFNGGRGTYEDEKPDAYYGSPLVALERAARAGVPATVFTQEIDSDNYLSLLHTALYDWPGAFPEYGSICTNLGSRDEIDEIYDALESEALPLDTAFLDELDEGIFQAGSAELIVTNDDYNNSIPRFMNHVNTDAYLRSKGLSGDKYLGVIFSDETGAGVPWQLLARVSRCHDRMEVVIHFTGTGLKRALGVQRSGRFIIRNPAMGMQDGLPLIRKKRWLIREPYGGWQWTFLLGTNWEKQFDYPSIGLHPLESCIGQQSAAKLTYLGDQFKAWREVHRQHCITCQKGGRQL